MSVLRSAFLVAIVASMLLTACGGARLRPAQRPAAEAAKLR